MLQYLLVSSLICVLDCGMKHTNSSLSYIDNTVMNVPILFFHACICSSTYLCIMDIDCLRSFLGLMVIHVDNVKVLFPQKALCMANSCWFTYLVGNYWLLFYFTCGEMGVEYIYRTQTQFFLFLTRWNFSSDCKQNTVNQLRCYFAENINDDLNK